MQSMSVVTYFHSEHFVAVHPGHNRIHRAKEAKILRNGRFCTVVASIHTVSTARICIGR